MIMKTPRIPYGHEDETGFHYDPEPTGVKRGSGRFPASWLLVLIVIAVSILILVRML
jgi:hypothetical protein